VLDDSRPEAYSGAVSGGGGSV